jgi:hypothetical protein
MSEGFIADASVGVAWAVPSQASDIRQKLPLVSREEPLRHAAQRNRVQVLP